MENKKYVAPEAEILSAQVEKGVYATGNTPNPGTGGLPGDWDWYKNLIWFSN